MSVVLDASITLAWLFDDESSDAADRVMGRVAAEGACVPSLWRLEVANALQNAVRRRRCDEAFVDGALARLRRFGIEIDAETDDKAWGATRALAREEGLTLYDAAYLELALRVERPLASRDLDLQNAARRRGVETLVT